MVTRVLIPGMFFFLALLAGVGMYAFSGLGAERPNPLLATQGAVPRPVPVGGATVEQQSVPVPVSPVAAPASEPAASGVTGLAGRAESRQITLYVQAKSDPSKLVAHSVTMDTAPGARDLVDRVITALQGPFEDPTVLPTVPRGTKLLSVFLMRKQMIVNLSRDVAMAHAGGTLGARMTIYSLVNSLIDLGLAEEVKVLVQGREELAFTDHMDLTHPMTFEASVILSKQAAQLAQEPPPAPVTLGTPRTAVTLGTPQTAVTLGTPQTAVTLGTPQTPGPGGKALKAIGGSAAAVGGASGR